MLKKAGIVVAASAAALLAVSPLAFAGDGGESHHEGRGQDSVQVNGADEGSEANGLIAIGEVNALNNVNVCPAIPVGVGVGDILGILSPGTANVIPSSDDLTCTNDDSINQGNVDDD